MEGTEDPAARALTSGLKPPALSPALGQGVQPAPHPSLAPLPGPRLPAARPSPTWPPLPPCPSPAWTTLPFSQTAPPLPAVQRQVKSPPEPWSWQVPPWRQGWESQGRGGCWVPGGGGRRAGVRLGAGVGGWRAVKGTVVLLTGRLV